MSHSRPTQTSSSWIHSQLGATAASNSNALHQAGNTETTGLNPTSGTRVLLKDPEGKIPDEVYDRDMQEQAAFTLKSNRIDNALADIDLIDINKSTLLHASNNEITIYYDAVKHPDENVLKRLIVEKLPDFTIHLKLATPEQIAFHDAITSTLFKM